MRRTPLTRVLTGLWALWLGVAIMEPAALHSCPVHGGVATSAHASHSPAEHAHQHGAQAPADKQHSAADCTCLGECCSVAPVAAPEIASIEVIPVAIRTQCVAIVAHDVAPASAPKYARPFSTAPPA